MICHKHSAAAHARPGMTLLELMVAVTISSILILSLAGVLGSTSSIYMESERSVEVLRDSRGMMGILRNDINGCLHPTDSILPIDYQRDPSTLKTRWGFFTLQSARAQDPAKNTGDICYVLYYTAITSDTNQRASRKLFRRLVSSDDTLAILQALTSGQPAGSLVSPDPQNDDVVANNVLDFRCEFRLRDTQGAWTTATTSVDIQNATEVVATLRLLTTEAAAAMTEAADWLPSSSTGNGFDFDDDEDDDATAHTFRARFQLNP